MANSVEIELFGVQKLVKKLERLPTGLQRKTLHIAFRSGGKIFAEAAKRRAARRTGLLAKSLGNIKTKTKQKGVVRYKVHPKKGFRRVLKQKRDGSIGVFGKKKKSAELSESKGSRIANPQAYAHLVELGTKHARAHPFMKPAFDARQRIALRKIKGLIGIGLEKAAKRG